MRPHQFVAGDRHTGRWRWCVAGLSGVLVLGGMFAGVAPSTAAPATVPAGVAAAATSEPTPSPSPTGPIAPSAAVAAAAEEVRQITGQQAAAQAELIALQERLARAQDESHRAAEALVSARRETARAKAAVAAAQKHFDNAVGALADQAAIAYQQGSDTSKIAFMLASDSPNTLMDLAQMQAAVAERQVDAVESAQNQATMLTARLDLLAAQERGQVAAKSRADRARVEAQNAAAAGTARAQTLAATLEKLQAKLDSLTAAAQTAQADAARAAAARSNLGADRLGAYGADAAAAQAYAFSQLGAYGWDASEFGCLVALWNGESGWSWSATNPSSGAYGIPQALPSYKMASAGADWLVNPQTQIRWGMTYIAQRYGTACGALDAWEARSPHWY